MPQKRSFAKLFGKPNAERATQTLVEPEAVSDPILPATITERQDHERSDFIATFKFLEDKNTRAAARTEENGSRLVRQGPAVAPFAQQIKDPSDSEKTSDTANSEHTASLRDAQRTIAQLQADLRTAREQKTTVGNENATLRQDVQALRISSGNRRKKAQAIDFEQDPRTQALKKQVEGLEAERALIANEMRELSLDHSRLLSVFGAGLTPRMVLALLSDRRFPKQPALKNTSSLDAPLNKWSKLTAFCESIAPGSPGNAYITGLSFFECPHCNICRISDVNAQTRRLGLPSSGHTIEVSDEFPRYFRERACADIRICSACLPDSLKISLINDWWYELGSQTWIKCPMDNCGRRLEIRNADDFGHVLQGLSGEHFQLLKSMYVTCIAVIRNQLTNIPRFERALILRQALANLNPRPTPESLAEAAKLHNQLVAFGRMRDLFADDPHDEDGPIPTFEAGEIVFGGIDRGELVIPIFAKCFQRSTTGQECIICTESYLEIDWGPADEWILASEGFEGPWPSKMMHFPTRDMQACEHPLNVCKKCFEKYLEERLTQNARNPEGCFTCPECRRALEPSEVKHLASVETLAK